MSYPQGLAKVMTFSLFPEAKPNDGVFGIENSKVTEGFRLEVLT
jgi:hypothetical protein